MGNSFTNYKNECIQENYYGQCAEYGLVEKNRSQFTKMTWVNSWDFRNNYMFNLDLTFLLPDGGLGVNTNIIRTTKY